MRLRIKISSIIVVILEIELCQALCALYFEFSKIKNMEKLNYKRTFFISIILIALGVTFSTTLNIGSLGTVLIAVGGLFFIASMAKKRKVDAQLESTKNKAE